MSKLANLPKMAQKCLFDNFAVIKLNLKLIYLTSAALSTGLSILVDQIVCLDMAK